MTLTGYFRPRYVNVPEPQLNPIPAATEPCDSSRVAAGIQSCAPAGPAIDSKPPSTSAISSCRMTISSFSSDDPTTALADPGNLPCFPIDRQLRFFFPAICEFLERHREGARHPLDGTRTL